MKRKMLTFKKNKRANEVLNIMGKLAKQLFYVGAVHFFLGGKLKQIDL
jgi:hypothetical protein